METKYFDNSEYLVIADQNICNRLMVKCPYQGKMPQNGQFTSFITQNQDLRPAFPSGAYSVYTAPFIQLLYVNSTGGMLLQRYHRGNPRYSAAPTAETDWYFHFGDCRQIK